MQDSMHNTYTKSTKNFNSVLRNNRKKKFSTLIIRLNLFKHVENMIRRNNISFRIFICLVLQQKDRR